MKFQGGGRRLAERGRSPHGERGLKCEPDPARLCQDRRSPHGERGLKLAKGVAGKQINYTVAPLTGSVD